MYSDIKDSLFVLLETKASPSVFSASSLSIRENQDAEIVILLITPPSPIPLKSLPMLWKTLALNQGPLALTGLPAERQSPSAVAKQREVKSDREIRQ